jgi:flagellar basal-body rod protein FlgB
MFVNKVEVLNMTRAMARHAATRHGVVARNIANADTPGYRARDLPSFSEVWQAGGSPIKATRSGHIGGGTRVLLEARQDLHHTGPNGNSVSLEAEMVKAADARQAHEMALAVHRSLSGNIRTALGRR